MQQQAQFGAPVDKRARIDELTGVATRLGFFEQAAVVFDTARDPDAMLTVVFIDLNGLAFVNDTYGHHSGSELIREAAAALCSVAREGDLVGRLGGDELALLRPGGTDGVEQLRFEVGDAVALASRSDRPFGLSVSVGVAIATRTEADSIDGLLSLADEAMYEHKIAGGGNRGRRHTRASRR